MPVYGIGRLLGGARAGLLAAALFATAPFFVTYAQQARAYTLLNLTATTAVFGLTYLLADPQRALRPIGASFRSLTKGMPSDAWRSDLAWLAYALGVAFTLYAHSTGVFLPLVANLVAIVWWILRGHRERRFVWNWLLANLLPLVLWLWWLPIMIALILEPMPGTGWITSPSLADVVQSARMILGQAYLPQAMRFLSPLPHAVLPLAVLLGLWALRRQAWPAAPVVSFMIVVPAIFALTSLLVPIWLTRVFIWPSTLAFIVAAIGLAAIRTSWLRYICIAGVLLLQATNLSGYYKAQAENRVHYEAWDDLAWELSQRAEPGDAILFLKAGGTSAAYEYYDQRPDLPRFSLNTFGQPPRVDNTAPLIPPTALDDILRRHGTLWAVGRHCDNPAACLPANHWKRQGLLLVEVWRYYGITLYRIDDNR